MARLQVSCISRGKKDAPHERIAGVGGLSFGAHWRHTSAEAIAAIENGVNTYFVEVNKLQTDLVVASHFGTKYLKAEGDTTVADPLASLPSCPY